MGIVLLFLLSNSKFNISVYLSNNTFESRRRLEKMPFDKRFDVDGNSELCHATGYEVFDGEDWWDSNVLFCIFFLPFLDMYC